MSGKMIRRQAHSNSVFTDVSVASSPTRNYRRGGAWQVNFNPLGSRSTSYARINNLASPNAGRITATSYARGHNHDATGTRSGCNTPRVYATGQRSQRNAERQGFRTAYTRIKWQLRDRQLRDSQLLRR